MAIQRPSPPGLVTKTRNKIALGLAGGGLALGIGLVLLLEMVLNHSYNADRKSSPAPLARHAFDSYQGINGRPWSRLALVGKWSAGTGKKTPRSGSKANLAPWEVEHFIRPYSEAIRDRLGYTSSYMELPINQSW